MDLEKLKRIKNLIIAKILFVFGWIYDLAMRILNAVNKTPIEKDKDRRNIRIKQFAIATSILYVIFNSIFIYVIKSLRSISTVNGSADYSKTHFMPWNIIVPPGFMMFIFELILSLIVGLGITVKLHTLYRMKNDSKNVKGDNKFMEDNELLDHFLAVPMDNITSAEKAGMLIGESNGVYYIEPGTYNTMTVGAPRSGKGECYVLPSLRLMANAKEKPSVIVNDMKGELLELTYKEFELLMYLMRHKSIAVSRDKLMEMVWGYEFAGETRTVDMHIKTLRQKLEAAGCTDLIKTVRGIGYKI